MILLTEKKLSDEEYKGYLYEENEPAYSFKEMDLSLEELTSDIFEEDDGSFFMIADNKVYYIYPEYGFYKICKDSGDECNSKILLESTIKRKKFMSSEKYLAALKAGADAVFYKTERDNADYELYYNKITQDGYNKINRYINDKKEMALKLLINNKTNNIEITSGMKDGDQYSLKADYNNGEHRIAVHYININKYKELMTEIIR